MTPEQMKKVRDEHVDAETRKDLDGALATYHEDCFYTNVPLGLTVRGKREIGPYYAQLFQAFPDSELESEGQAFADDVMVDWGTFRGTSQGKFMGLEPTGQTVALPVVAVFTFRDGLMLGEHLYYDLVTLCAQAGIELEQLRAAMTRFRAAALAS